MSNTRLPCPRAWPLAVVLLAALPAIAPAADGRPVTTVGVRGHVDGVVLPGPELEVRPQEGSGTPFVLRIAKVQPHGTAFRYDFVYYGLEPRTFDLMQYLRPKDGSKAIPRPPLEVEVRGLLAPGLVHPHELQPKKAGWFGGYQLLLLTGSVVWVVGLLFILLWGRERKKLAKAVTAGADTVAARLRLLVTRAVAGSLTGPERAELERILLSFWRRRLGLETEKAPEALAKMRKHPEAGVLLGQLDLWLHSPGTEGEVDVSKLLRPYLEGEAERPADAAKPQGVVA